MAGGEARPRRPGRRTLAQVFLDSLLRNKLALFGTAWLLLVCIVLVTEPVLPLPSPTRINISNTFAKPSSQHLLGTDENGRDVLARLIDGGRVSILVGIVSALLTVVVGGTLGVVAGYAGGPVDRVIMRVTDGVLSIPVFFLLLAVVALFGSSITVLVLALSFTRWMGPARLIRGEIMRVKELEYSTAVRSLGAGHVRIMFRHLLPQAMPLLIVATSIGVGNVMLVEAGLSFLGLGIAPPTPSWGNMLTASQFYMWSAPQLAVYPGLMILLTVLAFNAVGDVIRDTLDPRRRSGG
ncbi:MAG: ABC transporter permease [Trueperaceae bacterium]|nr:ABC transporter permease [Trueperaceae bacterium]MCW5819658.1 ABC transporter permease [Trueperaceae bacterium]